MIIIRLKFTVSNYHYNLLVVDGMLMESITINDWLKHVEGL